MNPTVYKETRDRSTSLEADHVVCFCTDCLDWESWGLGAWKEDLMPKRKRKKKMFLKGRSSLRKKKVKILVGGKIQELGEDPGGPGDVWG